jgi:hypothetical protein
VHKQCSVSTHVTNFTLSLHLYSQVQELLSTDAPLSKDTLSKAYTVLQEAADKLAADAAAEASKSDAATAATAQQEEATAATQPADELGSAVHELLLDLGKTLGVGTSLPDEVCTH